MTRTVRALGFVRKVATGLPYQHLQPRLVLLYWEPDKPLEVRGFIKGATR